MKQSSHTRPSFRNPGGDPYRWLLAAVVRRAVRDCLPTGGKISPQNREEAAWFLSGEEGLAWLCYFGIPAWKAREFVNRVVSEGE